jgi:hypothetical protein
MSSSIPAPRDNGRSLARQMVAEGCDYIHIRRALKVGLGARRAQEEECQGNEGCLSGVCGSCNTLIHCALGSRTEETPEQGADR